MQGKIVIPKLYQVVFPGCIIRETDLGDNDTDRSLDMKSGVDKRLEYSNHNATLGQRIQRFEWSEKRTMTFRVWREWAHSKPTECEWFSILAALPGPSIAPSYRVHVYINKEEDGIASAIIINNDGKTFDKWMAQQVEIARQNNSMTGSPLGVRMPVPLAWSYLHNTKREGARAREWFYAIPYTAIPSQFIHHILPPRAPRLLLPLMTPPPQPPPQRQPRLF